MSNNTTYTLSEIMQMALDIIFNPSYNWDGEKLVFLSNRFEVPENRLNNFLKGYLLDNLELEDLGRYFYDEDLFNEYGEIESSEFLIYNSDMQFLVGCFFDEYLEVCQEFGNNSLVNINYVIEQAVIAHKENLEN